MEQDQGRVWHPTSYHNVYYMAGILKNSGSGFYWLEDDDHTRIHFDEAIETESDRITIHFPECEKILTLMVNCDETYPNINVGCSVGKDNAVLKFWNMSTKVFMDPSVFTHASGNFWVFGMMIRKDS